MTIKDLKTILDKHSVHPTYYKILENNLPVGDTYLHLKKNNTKYSVSFIERNQIMFKEDFSDEHSACQYILKNLSYDYPELKQYINS